MTAPFAFDVMIALFPAAALRLHYPSESRKKQAEPARFIYLLESLSTADKILVAIYSDFMYC